VFVVASVTNAYKCDLPIIRPSKKRKKKRNKKGADDTGENKKASSVEAAVNGEEGESAQEKGENSGDGERQEEDDKVRLIKQIYINDDEQRAKNQNRRL
jgi:hypothetical protein